MKKDKKLTSLQDLGELKKQKVEEERLMREISKADPKATQRAVRDLKRNLKEDSRADN